MRKLTIVIKLGTSSIVSENDHKPLLSTLAAIVETTIQLRKDGHNVILVSSGAIGLALQLMKLERRPRHLPQVQALAAIGQSHLMSLWESLFNRLGQQIAQILLTRNDIADRNQWQNAQNTIRALLDMDVVPIVNENDTLSVAEIKFGDNDTLSAITAGMVHADYLFLMTDVPCLFDKNPREHPNAVPIEVVTDTSELARSIDTSTGGSALGTGGMETKLVAARLATSGGVTTVITKSSDPSNIAKIVSYVENIRNTSEQPLASKPSASNAIFATPNPSLMAGIMDTPPQHTRFVPALNPIRDRYFWLLHGLKPHGTIFIDEGAYGALDGNANLLPAGVVDVEGNFAQQEAVRICVVRRLHQQSLEPSEFIVPMAMTPSVAADVSPNPLESSIGSLQSPSAQTPPSVPYEIINGLGFESGRAIVNYSAAEIRKIRGYQGKDIEEVLGYADSEYVALRENIAFLKVEEKLASEGV